MDYFGNNISNHFTNIYSLLALQIYINKKSQNEGADQNLNLQYEINLRKKRRLVKWNQ